MLIEADLDLASLNDAQISKAKDANGKRRQITHALACAKHGITLGTKKQCRKYHSAWKEIFKNLFGNRYETGNYEPSTYECSENVVMELINESDKLKPKVDFIGEALKKEKLLIKTVRWLANT